MKILYSFSILISSFLIIPSIVLAQFKVEVVGGISSSYRMLTTDDPTLESNVEHLNEVNSPKLNYQLGINLIQYFTPNLALTSGVKYVEFGYFDNTDQPAFWPSGQPTKSLGDNFTTHRFIEIPFGIRYTLLQSKKMKPYIETGISLYKYINSTSRYKSEELDSSHTSNEADKVENYSTLLIPVRLALGVEYSITDRIAVFVQAVGKYHTIPDARDMPIDRKYTERTIEFGAQFTMMPVIKKDE